MIKITGTYEIEGRGPAVSITVSDDVNYEQIKPGIFVFQGSNRWQILTVDRDGFKPIGLILRGVTEPKNGLLKIADSNMKVQ